MTAPNPATKRNEIKLPLIDPRIKGCGVSKLREMSADKLRQLGDSLVLLYDGDDPCAMAGLASNAANGYRLRSRAQINIVIRAGSAKP